MDIEVALQPGDYCDDVVYAVTVELTCKTGAGVGGLKIRRAMGNDANRTLIDLRDVVKTYETGIKDITLQVRE